MTIVTEDVKSDYEESEIRMHYAESPMMKRAHFLFLHCGDVEKIILFLRNCGWLVGWLVAP